MSTAAAFSIALILASYLLYPIWLRIRVRLRPRPWKQAAVTMPVTVVLSAHNEAMRLEARLGNLRSMHGAELLQEIIVVLDGCSDGSAGLLAELAGRWKRSNGPKLTIIEQPRAGKSMALNRAMGEVGTPIVLFADARQTFDADVITLLLENFADPSVGAVSGALCFSGSGDEAAGLYWQLEKSIRHCQALTGSVMGATGAIYALRRELFLPLRPDELVDDLATPLAVIAQGYRVVFDERARAWDEPSTDHHREWLRKVRTLTGVWQALPLVWRLVRSGYGGDACRFAAHKGSRLLVPWALLALLLSSLLAGGAWTLFGLLQLLGYLLVAVAHKVAVLRQLPLVSTGYFFVLLNLAAAKALWLAWSGGGRQVWTSLPTGGRSS
ncbi:MAG: glycosyltransferase [Alcanivoracaceae bacterium]